MKKLKLMFVCTGNSCRSQMAEGLLRHLAGDRFEVVSSGTHPMEVSSRAIEAMREIGIDISDQRPKNVQRFKDTDFDYVVTVCDSAKQACPVFTRTKETLHWSVPDPFSAGGSSDERAMVFRRVRNEIEERIENFLESIGSRSRG